MFISGLWHGAGYLFVLWGLLHGVYLSINHAWRIFGGRLRQRSGTPASKRQWPGFVLTFLAVVVAMVLFRSTNLAAAKEILQGMAGLTGIGLPTALFDSLGSVAGRLHGLVHASTEMSATDFLAAILWVGALLACALLLPNTLQILDRFGPALSAARPTAEIGWLRRVLSWSPSLSWAIGLSVLAVAAVMRLGGQSEFLYWQF